ncbi:MAG: cyclase family protein [Frankiales bacterium]|nr:cyclase family protein [Frankiales bacterium]
MTSRVLDLSHELRPGMFTHPGLPGPQWQPHRTRQEYEQATGTTFQIDELRLVGNTGTYLDSPYHRFADGADLAHVPLERVVDVPIVVVDARATRTVGPEALAAALGDDDLRGTAVLVLTGGDRHWGEREYAADAPYLTSGAAAWLVERAPSLVGIDAVNIDDLADVSRPVHTLLLSAGLLIIEHLTGLGTVPARGARLHAAPLGWHGVGTWPVRAYALIP